MVLDTVAEFQVCDALQKTPVNTVTLFQSLKKEGFEFIVSCSPAESCPSPPSEERGSEMRKNGMTTLVAQGPSRLVANVTRYKEAQKTHTSE